MSMAGPKALHCNRKFCFLRIFSDHVISAIIMTTIPVTRFGKYFSKVKKIFFLFCFVGIIELGMRGHCLEYEEGNGRNIDLLTIFNKILYRILSWHKLYKVSYNWRESS